jgi:hypothetical protein
MEEVQTPGGHDLAERIFPRESDQRNRDLIDGEIARHGDGAATQVMRLNDDGDRTAGRRTRHGDGDDELARVEGDLYQAQRR